MSKGEEKIAKLLTRKGITFEREKTFTDLRHGIYRYDFYLPDYQGGPAIIEFQGRQHYEFIAAFYKSQVDFKQAQGRDMRKIEYCLAHDIPIYLVPYWDSDKLTSAMDLLNSDYIATTKFQNFLDWDKHNQSSAKS